MRCFIPSCFSFGPTVLRLIVGIIGSDFSFLFFFSVSPLFGSRACHLLFPDIGERDFSEIFFSLSLVDLFEDVLEEKSEQIEKGSAELLV